MILDFEGIEPKEYVFPEDAWAGDEKITLKIRPYPNSLVSLTMRRGDDGTVDQILTGQERRKKFIYCLISADGLKDTNGKPVPMTDDNKGKIFDHAALLGVLELRDFVLTVVDDMGSKKGEQEKN